MPLALVALFDEQCTTCNSPRLMSGSTRYFPLGLKVAVILPDLKSSMDVSTIPDVDVGGRSDERDAALALFRMDRRSWALLIIDEWLFLLHLSSSSIESRPGRGRVE